MLLSFMYQDRHQRYPKITQTHKKKQPHQPEYHKSFVINDVDEDGEFEHHEIVLPKIPPHQIPNRQGNVHTNWKT